MENKNTQWFDLNIQEILKFWKVSDAIRELIANAIDESILSNTKKPLIYQENEKWIIEDFGRGLSKSHLVQNENPEKINSGKTIGKFGIGLKDAIAVLNRENINFKIYTKELIMTPCLKIKEGFDEKTIHIKINSNTTEKTKGTKIIFNNLNSADIQEAKNNFLIFMNNDVLFENEYGQILLKKDNSYIFVNGMKVAIDEEYIFSYNIKKINKKLESKMNRERKSLGREAYSEIIEKIITKNIPEKVIDHFEENWDNSGELSKKNIRKTIFELLNNFGKYIFLTEEQLKNLPEGKKEIYSALNKKIKIIKSGDKDLLTNLYNDQNAVQEYNDNFIFETVDLNLLNNLEKDNLKLLKNIILKLDNKKEIVIVKKNNILSEDLNGYWSSEDENKLFLVKKILNNKDQSIKTLIHEYAHSKNGYYDSSRDFENDLSDAWFDFHFVE